jgi:hypothetical protein
MTYDAFLHLFAPHLRDNIYFLSQIASIAQFESINSKETPGSSLKIVTSLIVLSLYMTLFYFITAFGSSGFYLILKGSVRPLSVPHLNRHNMKLRTRTPEPALTDDIEIVSFFNQ